MTRISRKLKVEKGAFPFSTFLLAFYILERMDILSIRESEVEREGLKFREREG